MRPIKLALIASLLATPSLVTSQAAEPLARVDRRVHGAAHVSITLTDGSKLYGRLNRIGADSVVIDGISGRTALAMSLVREVRDAGTPRTSLWGKTEYWFPNANTTRLFFAPTGRTLAKGEGYFASHQVFVGSVTGGLSDRVTLGGGGLLLPGSNLWFITPKVGLVKSEQFNLATGALFGGWGAEGTGGIAFVAATLGKPDGSLTVALGNSFIDMELEGSTILMIGGEKRTSRRTSFVTENYFISGERALISYGIRILGEKTSIDLAFLNSPGQSMVFPGIPFVDFVVRF
jgi:hypothetical protein